MTDPLIEFHTTLTGWQTLFYVALIVYVFVTCVFMISHSIRKAERDEQAKAMKAMSKHLKFLERDFAQLENRVEILEEEIKKARVFPAKWIIHDFSNDEKDND